MKKIKNSFPIVLAVWPYLCFLIVFLHSEDMIGRFLGIYCVLTVIVYLANIIYACLMRGGDACYRLAFWNMIIKLCHIPFYIGIFLLGVVFLLAMVVPALLFISPMIVGLFMIIDFFLMITSSAYGINALIRAGKRKALSVKCVVVNVILHLIFVCDTISAVYVFIKLKKGSKVAISGGKGCP